MRSGDRGDIHPFTRALDRFEPGAAHRHDGESLLNGYVALAYDVGREVLQLSAYGDYYRASE